MKKTFKKIIKIIPFLLIFSIVFVASFYFINRKLNLKDDMNNIAILNSQNAMANKKVDHNTMNLFNTLKEKVLANKDDTSKVLIPQIVNNKNVEPYYYGVGAKELTPKEVSMLTVDFRENTPVFTTAVSPVDQVWYFAYPDSYPPLTSIKDQNGFELIYDFKMTTGNDIINARGERNSYRIYEYVNVTSLSLYKVSYIQ